MRQVRASSPMALVFPTFPVYLGTRQFNKSIRPTLFIVVDHAHLDGGRVDDDGVVYVDRVRGHRGHRRHAVHARHGRLGRLLGHGDRAGVGHRRHRGCGHHQGGHLRPHQGRQVVLVGGGVRFCGAAETAEKQLSAQACQEENSATTCSSSGRGQRCQKRWRGESGRG